MRSASRKKAGAPDKPNQLDLFASPQIAKLPEPSSALIVKRQLDALSPPLSAPSSNDPLAGYVLAGRRRGRPEKQLADTDDEASSSSKLVDVREAARILGLSKSTLDKMRCSGKGPPFVRATERAVRYDPVDLKAFKTERRRRSTTEEVLAALRR